MAASGNGGGISAGSVLDPEKLKALPPVVADAVRQGLAADHRHPDISSATKAMSAWHSTEPASVHLGIAARTEAPSLVDVDAALYEERSLG